VRGKKWLPFKFKLGSGASLLYKEKEEKISAPSGEKKRKGEKRNSQRGMTKQGGSIASVPGKRGREKKGSHRVRRSTGKERGRGGSPPFSPLSLR